SGAGKCDFMKMDKTATGFVFDSECKLDSGTVQTHGVVTGSLDAAYSMDVTTKHVGAAPPSMPAESHMKIDGKWLGACKAGQRPGDVMMPNGMTINVLDAAKMAPPQMPKRP
ncbi:MAG: DUF3617 family protein, partial [Pseudolabrys sp.]|nr:DUF3617 family protein [Pseudolabrys sp.]